jgi:hypothetical protein
LVFSSSLISSPTGLPGTTTIDATGRVNYPTDILVTTNFTQIIAVNNLSLGVNIGDNFDFSRWRNDVTLREKVAACNFRLVRLFIHEIQPCIQWNETLHKGEYSWELFDRTIERVLEMGAEPLLVMASGNWETRYWLPREMNGNYQNSKLPSNESFGAFCSDLIRHCNIEKNWQIRFWEIWNEPEFCKSDPNTEELSPDLGRISNFAKLFDYAARAMHSVDSTVLCGHGFSAIKSFFDYFVASSEGLGFFSIHDYDTHATTCYRSDYYKTESEIMADASVIGYQKPGVWKTYSPWELRTIWRQQKGQELPVLITETNANSASANGTDPRMQTVFGAAWYAEKLRSAVLENVTYCAYFTLASDHSDFWNGTELTRGFGFGLMNSTPPYAEWFPYFTNLLLGSELRRNDVLCNSSTSDFSALSSLAWTTRTHHCILLIGKTACKASVTINFAQGSVSDQTSVQVLRINGNSCGIACQNCFSASPLLIEIDGFSIVMVKMLA